jgi:hypothetical protein
MLVPGLDRTVPIHHLDWHTSRVLLHCVGDSLLRDERTARSDVELFVPDPGLAGSFNNVEARLVIVDTRLAICLQVVNSNPQGETIGCSIVCSYQVGAGVAALVNLGYVVFMYIDAH